MSTLLALALLLGAPQRTSADSFATRVTQGKLVEAGSTGPAFGMLVLASPDPQRFQSGLATDFLERIAELASAALSRLRPR